MSDAPVLIDQRAGSSPLIISVPHAGMALPAALKDRMTAAARFLPDTDWYVDRLFDFAPSLDVTVIKANISRYVIDLNRDPSGESLYPGFSVTELCPTTTFDHHPIYLDGQEPDAAEIRERILFYYQPYHALLKAEIKRIKDLHGYCILFDAHSIRSQVERFFVGVLPDLNWGTNDGATCGSEMSDFLESFLGSSESGFTAVTNGRFKGGFITRHYGRPEEGVYTLQLEIAQSAYMDENPPYTWESAMTGPLKKYLLSFIEQLSRLKMES